MTNPDSQKSQTLHEQLTDDKLSAFARYQQLALGSTSIAYLILYEFVMLFSSWVPGALGLLLRKWLYPLLLEEVGKGVVFGRNVSIRHGKKIRIGDRVIIDDDAVLDAKGDDNHGIRIGANSIISRNVILSCKGGNIQIGSDCTVGINTLFHALSGSDVCVADGVLIGAFTYLIGSGPYRSDALDIPFKMQGVEAKGGVKISDNVWIGSHVQVLDGVEIGEGCIIAASALVNRSVDDFSVVAGVPAKLIRSRLPS